MAGGVELCTYVASATQLSGLASTPCRGRPVRLEEAAQTFSARQEQGPPGFLDINSTRQRVAEHPVV